MALTVHRDTYDDHDLVEEIDGYDRRRNARFSVPPERQLHADRFGVADFYGWSLEKVRQVSQPERADLAAYLLRQGFRFDPIER